MIRRLAVLAAVAAFGSVSGTVAAQNPTAALNSPNGEFTFANWLDVNNAAVGNNKVNDNNVVYFIKEKAANGFQSWFLFFDPRATQTVTGLVTFPTAISQLYTTKADIDNSTETYGLTDVVSYESSKLIGLEATDQALFADNELSIDFTASTPGDHMRILTIASSPSIVPEPAALSLLGFGLVGLVGIARRRRA